MTLTPLQEYHSKRAITIVFDTDDQKQNALLRAFMKSFGDGHVEGKDLYPPRYKCLDVLPGGALEARR